MSDAVESAPARTAVSRAVLFLALCSLGGLSVLLLVPEQEAHAAGMVEVALAGESVPPALDKRAQARELAQRYLGGTLVLQAPGAALRVRRADLGVRVDLPHLQALLSRAGDPRSELRRVHQALLAGHPLALPMPAEPDPERTLELLLGLKDRVDRKPVDARLDPRGQRALPARPGVALDVYASLERIDHALVRGDAAVELASIPVPAKHGVERIEQIEMNAVLGEFTTRYNRGADMRNRTHNLRLAASKIDGYVVEPGEVFDFNAIVGDRTELSDFRMAPVIADGQLAEGMGGGTCQIASTLHAAVFFAGLPILTRYPHSHPSFYIKLGLDATVVYGSLNFRFRNDLPDPIVVEMTVDDGFVRAALHGKQRTRNVSFLRRIDEISQFEEKLVPDPSLPRNMRILQQRGIPGFKITRFRVVRDEQTAIARRERSSDSYPPTAQIWRVGRGGEPVVDFHPPKNDAHPEYVADEFMTATQGSGTDGIEVSAVPGRSGTFGWTEREKMMRPSKAGDGT
jgi:vancomycin resistance protein YoaR